MLVLLSHCAAAASLSSLGLLLPLTAAHTLDDDCLSLEPWRLAVCGDFVGGGPTPAEAAAASGLAAGERIAQIFA